MLKMQKGVIILLICVIFSLLLATGTVFAADSTKAIADFEELTIGAVYLSGNTLTTSGYGWSIYIQNGNLNIQNSNDEHDKAIRFDIGAIANKFNILYNQTVYSGMTTGYTVLEGDYKLVGTTNKFARLVLFTGASPANQTEICRIYPTKIDAFGTAGLSGAVQGTKNLTFADNWISVRTVINHSTGKFTLYTKTQSGNWTLAIENMAINSAFATAMNSNGISRSDIYLQSPSTATAAQMLVDNIKVYNVGTFSESGFVPEVKGISLSHGTKENPLISYNATYLNNASETYSDFQWLRSETINNNYITYSQISGATSSTYVPTANDYGKVLRVKIVPKDSSANRGLTALSEPITVFTGGEKQNVAYDSFNYEATTDDLSGWTFNSVANFNKAIENGALKTNATATLGAGTEAYKAFSPQNSGVVTVEFKARQGATTNATAAILKDESGKDIAKVSFSLANLIITLNASNGNIIYTNALGTEWRSFKFVIGFTNKEIDVYIDGVLAYKGQKFIDNTAANLARFDIDMVYAGEFYLDNLKIYKGINEFEIETPNIDLSETNFVKINSSVVKKSPWDNQLTVVFAMYDAENNLAGVNLENITVNSLNPTVPFEIKLPYSGSIYSNNCKMFVWRGMNSLIPLGEAEKYKISQ